MSDAITALMTASKNVPILLRMRNDKTLRGKLQDFDSYLNLTLNDAEDITDDTPVKIGHVLVRGDNIVAISLPKKPAKH